MQVADQVGPQQAPKVAYEEPVGNGDEIELLRDGGVHMSADGAIDEPVAEHHEEGTSRSKHGPAQQQQASAQGVEADIDRRVALWQAVAEPAPAKASQHVGRIVEGEERLRLQHEAFSQLNHFLVVDVQGEPGGEARKRESVDRKGQRIMPQLRQPVPAPLAISQQLPNSAYACFPMPGDPDRKDEQPQQVQHRHGEKDLRHRHLQGRAHEKESSDQDAVHTQWNAQDGQLLGPVPKGREAVQEVGLEGAHGCPAQGVREDHPVKVVALHCENHHRHDKHGEHHANERHVHSGSRMKSAEDYLVTNPKDEAKEIETGHCRAEVVGRRRAVVRDAQPRLHLMLEPKERCVAREAGEHHKNALPVDLLRALGLSLSRQQALLEAAARGGLRISPTDWPATAPLTVAATRGTPAAEARRLSIRVVPLLWGLKDK
mmetsp:Transcript_133889/g.317407  ORF Transcript_133889/g.317407 Transcript_133889/m.317407 type:complete len:431 (-) Transcript_133889:25-1317(-)